MKKAELELEDDLRPEYDLKSLRVRKLGSRRKSFGGSVAAIFPNADAVNEALRFLIRVTQQNQSPMNTTLYLNRE
ncbi:hypothetical protein [Pseudanabaena yagii]|uniref:Uncharacterized protein n=1 Tax=Pseudanabaena yagii GIHE-NHR1 TaxID=2722753 RepID=A0ABX1LQP5_9CYAN|nr:hypothetical protein [Pseudanabaena yagii GIHE-NHR1]